MVLARNKVRTMTTKPSFLAIRARGGGSVADPRADPVTFEEMSFNTCRLAVIECLPFFRSIASAIYTRIDGIQFSILGDVWPFVRTNFL